MRFTPSLAETTEINVVLDSDEICATTSFTYINRRSSDIEEEDDLYICEDNPS